MVFSMVFSVQWTIWVSVVGSRMWWCQGGAAPPFWLLSEIPAVSQHWSHHQDCRERDWLRSWWLFSLRTPMVRSWEISRHVDLIIWEQSQRRDRWGMDEQLRLIWVCIAYLLYFSLFLPFPSYSSCSLINNIFKQASGAEAFVEYGTKWWLLKMYLSLLF